MTPEQFAYWLQGFAEVNQSAPNAAQWTIIKDHLATVFKKETPNRITSPGPGIAAPAMPINPMNPNPFYPTYPGISPTYPGTRPEVICSVTAPGTGINWSSGAGTAYSMCTTSDVPQIKYDYFTTAKKETIRKINRELSK